MDTHLIAVAMLLASLAGCGDGVGGWICLVSGAHVGQRQRLYSTAVAAGFMLGIVLLDRVPELFGAASKTALGPWVLCGFLCIYLLENLVHSHSHHPAPPDPLDAGMGLSVVASVAAQGGLLLHTFFDGVAIGAGFATSAAVGTLMFLAVIFHKIPEGFSLASFVLAAGRGAQAAFRSSVWLGVSTVVGAVSALSVSTLNEGSAAVLLAVATGSFLYVTTCSMLPAINTQRDNLSTVFVGTGIVLYITSAHLLHLMGVH